MASAGDYTDSGPAAAARRRPAIAPATSSAPKTAEPATRCLAPAATSAPAFSGPTPPSTAIPQAEPLGADRLREPFHAGQRVGEERLAAPAGVHRHDEDEVAEAHRLVEGRERRPRVDRHPRRRAPRPDELRESVKMRLRLHVDRDARRAGVEVLVERPERFLDHQMDVERDLRVPSERAEDQGTDRQVGDEVPVHDVEMDEVGPGLLARRDRLVEAPEVRGQEGRGDPDGVGHGTLSADATTNETASFRVTGKPACGNCRRIVPAAAPS